MTASLEYLPNSTLGVKLNTQLVNSPTVSLSVRDTSAALILCAVALILRFSWPVSVTIILDPSRIVITIGSEGCTVKGFIMF
jgi:hypothetical protein